MKKLILTLLILLPAAVWSQSWEVTYYPYPVVDSTLYTFSLENEITSDVTEHMTNFETVFREFFNAVPMKSHIGSAIKNFLFLKYQTGTNMMITIFIVDEFYNIGPILGVTYKYKE